MTEHHAAPGPYETEGQARGAVAHILASPQASWTDGNYRLMEDTCRAAGVELGAFDEEKLFILASHGPTMVAVLVGLFERFREGARPSPLQQLMGPPGVAQAGGGWLNGPMDGVPGG